MKLRLSAPFAASVSLRITMMAGEGVAVFVIVFGYPRARSRECVMQMVTTVGSLCAGELMWDRLNIAAVVTLMVMFMFSGPC